MARLVVVLFSVWLAVAPPASAQVALPFVGHFQTRNKGTICGSIAHADPAAELPAERRVFFEPVSQRIDQLLRAEEAHPLGGGPRPDLFHEPIEVGHDRLVASAAPEIAQQHEQAVRRIGV